MNTGPAGRDGFNCRNRTGIKQMRRWLPDMDLNHDKQIQSLLCYRYTIGQTGASPKLMVFKDTSSCP